MRSYVIHLARAADRAWNVAHLLQALPCARIMEAVDGELPDSAPELARLSRNMHHPAYPFQMSRAEIACFLSHRRCWKEIAEGDAPYALIAEDDMTVDPVPFAAALELARGHADEESFIRLPAKNRERAARAIARQGGAALFLPRIIGLQTVCQIVGRGAARRLLAVSEVFDRPVDTTLQMHWVTGQQVLTIQPNGISELDAPSTVQAKTRARDLLVREVRRASYRAQIRRKPQLA